MGIQQMMKFHNRFDALRPLQHDSGDIDSPHSEAEAGRMLNRFGRYHRPRLQTEERTSEEESKQSNVSAMGTSTDVAKKLLEVIALQQDEIAYLHTKTELDNKKAECTKQALEYIRAEEDFKLEEVLGESHFTHGGTY